MAQMNNNEERMLLCQFLGWDNITQHGQDYYGVFQGKLKRLPKLDYNLIAVIEGQLTGQMWAAYAAELENIMLNDSTNHYEKILYANMHRGMNILFRSASIKQLTEALLKSLGFWFKLGRL